MKYSNKPVLVTGASGFIAIHCIIQLLEQGYSAPGALTNAARESCRSNTLAKFVQANDRLTFVQADLLDDACWAEAVRGCDFVLRRLPISNGSARRMTDPPCKRRDVPRVLRAAAENGVKRVVLTSSVAAIAAGHPDFKTHFDESDWSLPDLLTIDPYSKVRPLLRAPHGTSWKNLPQGHPLELAVINPGLVLGPLPDTHQRTSGELIEQLLGGKLPGLARLQFTCVDVRDVASAHLTAMTTPERRRVNAFCVLPKILGCRSRADPQQKLWTARLQDQNDHPAKLGGPHRGNLYQAGAV